MKSAQLISDTRLTCEEFYEAYAVDHIDEVIQDLFWDDPAIDRMLIIFESLKRLAKKEGVFLTDVNSWDYDAFFYNIWECTEKGLS